MNDLISDKSDEYLPVIDYVLVQKNAIKEIGGVQIIPGEECFTQHRPLVTNLKSTKSFFFENYCQKTNKVVDDEE